MTRSAGTSRLPGFAPIALAAATMLAAPAHAEPVSYQDAFQSRVTQSNSRQALDTFIIEAAKEGQYDQALSTLEEVLLSNPNDLAARLALARIYYNIGSFDLASAHLEQAAVIAGSEQFAREIAALRARIERGLAGIETHLAVSAGVEYESASLGSTATTAADTRAMFWPYAMIDGGIVRYLDTASSDELRFGASATYDRALGDTDFDGDLDPFDRYMLRAQATYSKGLPDIIDTLRFDLSAYGLTGSSGGGRTSQELGTEAQLSFQPTVETLLRIYGGYGWLGASDDIYAEHRVRYGLAGEARIAAGVTVGAHVTGYTEWGTAPFAFSGGSTGYSTQGVEIGASVSHLLHVFEDGRSWVHEAGATYSRERVLDYGSLAASAASLADRESWSIYWNHSVQIATRTALDFGVSYGQDRVFGTAAPSQDRSSDGWGVSAGLTYQFN